MDLTVNQAGFALRRFESYPLQVFWRSQCCCSTLGRNAVKPCGIRSQEDWSEMANQVETQWTMKAIELTGDIDDQHRLQVRVPEELPARPAAGLMLSALDSDRYRSNGAARGSVCRW